MSNTPSSPTTPKRTRGHKVSPTAAKGAAKEADPGAQQIGAAARVAIIGIGEAASALNTTAYELRKLAEYGADVIPLVDAMELPLVAKRVLLTAAGVHPQEPAAETEVKPFGPGEILFNGKTIPNLVRNEIESTVGPELEEIRNVLIGVHKLLANGGACAGTAPCEPPRPQTMQDYVNYASSSQNQATPYGHPVSPMNVEIRPAEPKASETDQAFAYLEREIERVESVLGHIQSRIFSTLDPELPYADGPISPALPGMPMPGLVARIRYIAGVVSVIGDRAEILRDGIRL